MRYYSLVFVYFFIINVSFSQDSFGVKIFSELQGLSSNRINAIVQDHKGYIWLATDVGLSRFDGVNFVNFSNEIASLNIEDNAINKIFLYGDTLYLIFEGEGCVGFNVVDYGSKILTPRSVAGFLKVSDFEHYIFFNDGELSFFRKGVPLSTKKFSNINNSLLFANKTNVFVSVFGLGLCRLDAESLEIINNRTITTPIANSNRVVVDESGFYLQYINSVRRFSFDLDQEEVYLENAKFRNINQLSASPDGSKVFFLNGNKNIYIFSGNQINLVSPNLDLVNYEYRCIYPTNGGELLLGTNRGLLILKESVNRSDNFGFLPNFTKDKVRVHRKILEDGLGNFYFFGFPSITITNSNNQQKSYAFENIISTYDAIFYKNSIIATTEGWGLLLFDPLSEKWASSKSKLPERNDGEHFYSIKDVGNDKIFSCGNMGLVEFFASDSTIQYASSDARLRGNNYDIEHLPFADKLLVSGDNVIYVMDIKTREIEKEIPLINSSSSQVVYPRVMKLYSDNTLLLVGTNVGLFKIDLLSYEIIEIFTDRDFLIDNRILNIIEDDARRVWISTFKGIQAFDDSLHNGLKLYSTSTLINDEFNYRSAIKLRDGRMIFGGLMGYDVIDYQDYKSFTSDHKPQITALLRIDNNGEKLWDISSEFDQPITFYTGKESLIIFISALDVVNMSDYRVDYQINDFEWVRLNDSRSIFLTGLDEGWHTLNIRMYDHLGRSLTNELRVRIHAKKVFLESRSFLYVSIFVVLVLVFFIFFFLVQLRRRENKVKKQVSMDLHDEVGTLITRALLFSQSLKASSPIEETLREALYSLRLYINSMSKNKVKTEALKDEVTYFIMTHFEDKNISTDIRWRFPADAFISPEVYRNLRMIIFESANNCLKHAQAKTFALHVFYENKKMNVDIFDDGIFDPEKVKNKNGNGLRNILKRVDKLGGTCVFKLSELGGLQISIEIGLT